MMAEPRGATGSLDPATLADRLATAPTTVHPWVAEGERRVRFGTGAAR